ncbi:helix-turn-helix domain-containing protein [Sutcliffiella rhizosphaerae]|uniref:HTH cro/C1-type domain-containing protein n=1 Tax=Sutcliffiella rhizosphaerae TaxID=2880967 RepID=A0ABM8YMZ8_9BACI|nr:helix-turn-helix transcriptional regulator [Sutcliffiella rhizosphaerae]CAG9621234.1 hypothetical protein BACCIP111883_02006 [Sutcliffiella rhizosphaerae]
MAEKDPYAVALGKVIKIFRKKFGWTQEQMEEYTGLPPKAIGKFERGERAPSSKTQFHIINNKVKEIPADEFNELLKKKLNRVSKQ